MTAEQQDREPKPASPSTAQRNAAARAEYDDATDFEFASRGLVAQIPDGKISLDGRAVWDCSRHDFIRADPTAPATVHPGLWRQGRLNALHGLFEVADGVWQARGYDISNITFMAGDRGWVVIDPLTSKETAAACLGLANDTLGERPVTAVIYTHSHVDHFGGVEGVTSRDAVRAGDVRIVAPEGFLREAVSENGTAGPIMARRAHYQFGPLLPAGPQGLVNAGLGMGLPFGTTGLIAPTETIDQTGAELVLDGLRVVFQNTPDAEAPAEMNFFFPDLRLLCLAENCTHTLHNLYPIRGAQVRDALAWSKYLQEALVMWGDETDVAFASHHWPRFGQADVKAFIALQRDVYRWMHDQTLRLANHGYKPDEIAALLEQPAAFAGQSHVQGYYGTISHNVRSVYNRYLGWYDGNPAHLHPHPPADSGRRYVAMMGGADQVVAGAREAFDEGDYRWVVQVLDHVIYADPGNEAARLLSADAMEQLGYQSESATWRNAYLTGAMELRHGSVDLGRAWPSSVASALTGEQLVEMAAVRYDPARCNGPDTMIWSISDLGETHLVGLENAAVHHRADPPAEVIGAAGVHVSAAHATFVALIHDAAKIDDAIASGALSVDAGDGRIFRRFLGALDVFMTPRVIEPQPT